VVSALLRSYAKHRLPHLVCGECSPLLAPDNVQHNSLTMTGIIIRVHLHSPHSAKTRKVTKCHDGNDLWAPPPADMGMLFQNEWVKGLISPLSHYTLITAYSNETLQKSKG